MYTLAMKLKQRKRSRNKLTLETRTCSRRWHFLKSREKKMQKLINQ